MKKGKRGQAIIQGKITSETRVKMTGKLELPGFSVKGITETDKSGENEVCSQAETLYFKFGLHVGS